MYQEHYKKCDNTFFFFEASIPQTENIINKPKQY